MICISIAIKPLEDPFMSLSLLQHFNMSARVTRLFSIVLFAIVGVFLLWCWFFLQQGNGNTEIHDTLLQEENPIKTVATIKTESKTQIFLERPPTVLLATLWFNQQWLPSTNQLLSCPMAHVAVRNGNTTLALSCNITSDKSLFNISDAVVFHAREDSVPATVKELSSMPRPVNQRWVMFIIESPLNLFNSQKLKCFDSHGPLNWTATYMKNSDVQTTYYGVVPGVYHGGFDPTRDYLAGRTGMAAILVSNCWSPGRMEWIKKMQQYIDVKVYGSCGSECSRSERHECMAKLKKYKFYLSFENTYCRDYITEKIVSNAFENDIIPVVIGDINFTDTSVIPPRSAINALNFLSVKELTDYMKRVGNNSTLYNEYFKWHSHYRAVNFNLTRHFLCSLCRHLATNNSTKTYKSVEDWYSKKKLCRTYPVPL